MKKTYTCKGFPLGRPKGAGKSTLEAFRPEIES
jgi:hypothetical protein